MRRCECPAPAIRLTDKEIPRYRRIVIQAAYEISMRMGFGENSPAWASAIGRDLRAQDGAGQWSLTRRI